MFSIWFENTVYIPVILAIIVIYTIIVFSKKYSERIYSKLHRYEHPLVAVAYEEHLLKNRDRGSKVPRSRSALVALLHILLISLIILALANPYVVIEKKIEFKNKAVGSIEIDVRPPVVLIIDVSGSMKGRKLEIAKEALKTFINEVDGIADIGLVAFSDTIRMAVPPTSDLEELYNAIDNLVAEGGTMYSYPLETVLEWLKPYRVFNHTCIVVFATDGLPGDPEFYPKIVREYSMYDIPIYTIFIPTEGVGSRGIEVVKSIAEETGGKWFYPYNVVELVEVYQNIAETVKKTIANVTTSIIGYKTVKEKIYITQYILYSILAVALILGYTRYRFYRVTF